MPTIETAPEVVEADAGYTGRYATVIFNNDTNSFDEVVLAIMRATGCSLQEAYMETWEADHYGKANIHFGTQVACCAVAAIVSQIGVRTLVQPEWD